MKKITPLLTKPVILCLTVLVALTGCGITRYTRSDITPDQTHVYHSLTMKVNVKNKETGERGTFKIILKYNDTGDKMLFLSPLNQIYGFLVIERDAGQNGQHATLVHTKKKQYWKGPFQELLKELWGMDVDYQTFKTLVVEGKVADHELHEKGITVNVENPDRIRIETAEMAVRLLLSNRETGQGVLNLQVDLTGMNPATLRSLIE
ncbi:MAG: hypothetical protein ACM3SY_04720 [Candidatus Omnitrophota bacterium]